VPYSRQRRGQIIRQGPGPPPVAHLLQSLHVADDLVVEDLEAVAPRLPFGPGQALPSTFVAGRKVGQTLQLHPHKTLRTQDVAVANSP
jgi:hypothetical protein